MARLKAVEETMRLILNHFLFSANGSGLDDVEDVLSAPVISLEELDDLCTKLTHPVRKKRKEMK